MDWGYTEGDEFDRDGRHSAVRLFRVYISNLPRGLREVGLVL